MRYTKKTPGVIPLERKVVHLYRKVWNAKKNKTEKKWVRRVCGKRRAEKILDEKISVATLAKDLGMSGDEIINLRIEYLYEKDEPVVEKIPNLINEYTKYMNEVYMESYREIPLGAKGHIVRTPYLYMGNDRTIMSSDKPVNYTNDYEDY